MNDNPKTISEGELLKKHKSCSARFWNTVDYSMDWKHWIKKKYKIIFNHLDKLYFFLLSPTFALVCFFPEWTNPDFFHLDVVLFLNRASRNACVWDCSWDQWRAVALCQALALSLQYRWIASVLEKNNPKTLNKLCLMEINFFCPPG